MDQEKMLNYNIEVIINRLKNGESFNALEKFYNVSRETILEDIKKYYNFRTYEDVKNYLSKSKDSFNRPHDNSAISYAKYYKKAGYSYEEFVKLMEASKRPFSERAKLLAKQIFENDKNIEKHKDSNDEIEM